MQALDSITATEERPPAPPLPGDDAATQAPVREATTSVARNTLIMLASQIVTLATTLLWNVAVQSTLPAARFGQLFYAQSLALTGAVFMDMGIGTYLTKQVARDRAESARLLSTAISVRVFSTALIYTIIVLWALLDPSPHMDGEALLAVVLVGLAIVVASFTQACAATFQGNENMRWQALGNIAEKVSVMVVSVLLLWLGFGLVAVAGVMLGGALANLVVVGGQAARRGWVRPTFDRTLAWGMIRGGAPFFLWGAFGVIYQRNAALQLPRLVDSTVESWFGAAVRWYETLSFVPYIFQAAVLPVLSRAFVDSDDGLARTARRSFDLILLAALPISVGVVTLAPQMVALVGGLPKYAGAVDPLRVLGVSLVPLYVDMILATILISIDKQRAWAIVAVGAALLNPVANLWLIPQTQAAWQNGAVGAAAVTLLTEVGIFCFNIFMIPRGVLGGHSARFALRAVVAAAAMGLALWLAVPLLAGLMPGGATSRLGAALLLILAGALGGAVFGAAAWMLRLVGMEEVSLVRRALRRGSTV